MFQQTMQSPPEPPTPAPAVSTAGPARPDFTCPRRPDCGREGRPITLRANHFQIKVPHGDIQHYDITIIPDKCPRRVNREIIDTMVRHCGAQYFGNSKPVFDGRKNLYSRDPLPFGNDKVLLVGTQCTIAPQWTTLGYLRI